MAEDTVRTFGAEPRASTAPRLPPLARVMACRQCGSHFSEEGRFCPFDGEALTWSEAAPAIDDPLIGMLVDGRYSIEGVLGEGGVGIVYAVRHQALGKRFALKALRRDLTGDAEMAARFIQEARTAARLSHPGLVEITDYGELATGQVYFVMELLEGESLARLLRRGALGAERAVELVRKLARALAVAHAAGVVHRDLKPDNIHIGAADSVKILDFGLAKVVGGSRLTRAGMVFGTPHYMSPEQASGEVVDHRADIYAVGVLMYEMFAGHVPFEATSHRGVLAKHLYQTPPPPSVTWPGPFSASSLERMVMRCLEKRPEARYQSLAELLADLDDLPRGDGPAREAAAAQTGRRAELEAVVHPHRGPMPTARTPLPESAPLAVRPRSWRGFGLALGALALPLLAFELWRSLSGAPQGTASTATFRGLGTTVTQAPPALEPSNVHVSPGRPPLAASVRIISPATIPSAAREPLENTAESARAKPRRATPARASAPAISAAPPPTSAPRRLGGGEIIDPWQR